MTKAGRTGYLCRAHVQKRPAHAAIGWVNGRGPVSAGLGLCASRAQAEQGHDHRKADPGGHHGCLRRVPPRWQQSPADQPLGQIPSDHRRPQSAQHALRCQVRPPDQGRRGAGLGAKHHRRGGQSSSHEQRITAHCGFLTLPERKIEGRRRMASAMPPSPTASWAADTPARSWLSSLTGSAHPRPRQHRPLAATRALPPSLAGLGLDAWQVVHHAGVVAHG